MITEIEVTCNTAAESWAFMGLDFFFLRLIFIVIIIIIYWKPMDYKCENPAFHVDMDPENYCS